MLILISRIKFGQIQISKSTNSKVCLNVNGNINIEADFFCGMRYNIEDILERKCFMQISRNKVVIIGAGQVGTTIAFSLVNQEVCAEITLVDINETKAIGEAMDLQHGIEYFGRNTKITAGTYADCKDAEIVVITAAAPYSGELDRLLMMDKTANIVKAIVPKVMENGFDGIFVVVSNPVDIISYLVYKLSGLPKNQIIGTGTAIGH